MSIITTTLQIMNVAPVRQMALKGLVLIVDVSADACSKQNP